LSPAAWPWNTTGEDTVGDDLTDEDITGEELEEDDFRLAVSEACVLGSSVVCPGVSPDCVTCVAATGVKGSDGVLSRAADTLDVGRSVDGDSFSDTIVKVSTSESIEAVFGVTVTIDSPIEGDDSDSVVITTVLCTSTAEETADLISEVTMPVVRPEDSVLDVFSLPRLSAIAVAVEMTRDAVVSASCECSTSAGKAELVLTAVELVAVPHATTGVRTVVPGNNARGGSLIDVKYGHPD
jgi:hypothetical protein